MTEPRYLSFAVAMLLTCMVGAQTPGNTADPTKTAYGERNDNAPKELDVFSFLIGTWEGKAKAKLADGKVAEVAAPLGSGVTSSMELRSPTRFIPSRRTGSPSLVLAFASTTRMGRLGLSNS